MRSLSACLVLSLPGHATPLRAVLFHAPNVGRSTNVGRFSSMHGSGRLGSAIAPVMSDSERPDRQEPESLYTTPKLEFDAVTITALLGAAIAFQFFVLANL